MAVCKQTLLTEYINLQATDFTSILAGDCLLFQPGVWGQHMALLKTVNWMCGDCTGVSQQFHIWKNPMLRVITANYPTAV